MENVDGLLSAVEKNLGPRVFKVLLILCALAAAVTACSIIYTLGLRPLLAAFGLRLDLTSAWGIVALIFNLAGAAAITSSILDAYRKRIVREELERLIGRAQELSDEVNTQRQRAIELMRSSMDVSRMSGEFLSGTELILSAIYERARDQSLLDQDQLTALSEMIETAAAQAKVCMDVLDRLSRNIADSEDAMNGSDEVTPAGE